MTEETLEKDRLGEMLSEGERAGVASRDGEGEAERVGEPFTEGMVSGIASAMLVQSYRSYEADFPQR